LARSSAIDQRDKKAISFFLAHAGRLIVTLAFYRSNRNGEVEGHLGGQFIPQRVQFRQNLFTCCHGDWFIRGISPRNAGDEDADDEVTCKRAHRSH